nr:(+)-neomenthol dehydrogenase [Quercus suber]
MQEEGEITWNTMVTQTYELTEECLQTNYYGAKRMVEALNTLLQLSHSPTIVNVSSFMGKLKEIPNEWAQGVLTDAESLTEEKLDEVLSEFLKDFKEGSLEAKVCRSLTSQKVPPSSSMAEATKRYAVVTGGNKGIGFETCRQLALNGVTVLLTSRDEKRGIEAVDKFKESGLSDLVLFHQLDVTDPASIASLADFIKATFGKLDILEIPNEWAQGVLTDAESLTEEKLDEEIPNEWAQGVLTDAESLTEEKLDEVLSEFLKDFKEGSLEAKGWPAYTSAYIVSKAVLNAYTRILAKKYPSFCINCLCPGYVNTDINFHLGPLTAEESAKRVLRLALLPSGGPSGLFFVKNEVTPF